MPAHRAVPALLSPLQHATLKIKLAIRRLCPHRVHIKHAAAPVAGPRSSIHSNIRPPPPPVFHRLRFTLCLLVFFRHRPRASVLSLRFFKLITHFSLQRVLTLIGRHLLVTRFAQHGFASRTSCIAACMPCDAHEPPLSTTALPNWFVICELHLCCQCDCLLRGLRILVMVRCRFGCPVLLFVLPPLVILVPPLRLLHPTGPIQILLPLLKKPFVFWIKASAFGIQSWQTISVHQPPLATFTQFATGRFPFSLALQPTALLQNIRLFVAYLHHSRLLPRLL